MRRSAVVQVSLTPAEDIGEVKTATITQPIADQRLGCRGIVLANTSATSQRPLLIVRQIPETGQPMGCWYTQTPMVRLGSQHGGVVRLGTDQTPSGSRFEVAVVQRKTPTVDDQIPVAVTTMRQWSDDVPAGTMWRDIRLPLFIADRCSVIYDENVPAIDNLDQIRLRSTRPHNHSGPTIDHLTGRWDAVNHRWLTNDRITTLVGQMPPKESMTASSIVILVRSEDDPKSWYPQRPPQVQGHAFFGSVYLGPQELAKPTRFEVVAIAVSGARAGVIIAGDPLSQLPIDAAISGKISVLRSSP